MVLVLFVISVLTFLLFEAIPNGNPALRLAGRNATPLEIHLNRGQVRLQPADLRPVPADDEEHLHRPGVLLHAGLQRADRDQGRACRRRSRWRSARASSGCSLSIVVGTLAAVKAGRYTDRVLTVLAMIGVSFPPFFLGADADLLPRPTRPPSSRSRDYVPLTQDPVAVARAPDPAVVHAVGAVHRLLLARAALDDPRHDQRGLRPHGARQGPVRAPGADPPRRCATA